MDYNKNTDTLSTLSEQEGLRSPSPLGGGEQAMKISAILCREELPAFNREFFNLRWFNFAIAVTSGNRI
jgi:hypothetical protein